MGIRIVSREKDKTFRLWLPGILIWFFLLLAAALLIVPVFLVLIGLLIWNLIPGQEEQSRAFTRIFFSVPKIFWAMRGLTVDIESDDTIVKINF
ncbi:MAG: hypothetical protein K0B52_00965 [FCB group bacterium]|nr:hypothetical protein [FCB group bacterium]